MKLKGKSAASGQPSTKKGAGGRAGPAIVAELRRIAQMSGGAITPDQVVEAARPKSSPLHGKFTWGDSEAGHAWRLHQARNLLREVRIVKGPEGNQVVTRVFISLTTDRTKDGAGYREIDAVLSNQEYRQQLLADALEEMERFQSKYAALQELCEVFEAMRKMRRKIP